LRQHRHLSYSLKIQKIISLICAKITYQGRRRQSKPITSHVDPRGRQVYWIGLAGEAVAGQKIAEMGSTGATRTMLEFQVRLDGKPINPTIVLPLN
jgi:hypothetical protein